MTTERKITMEILDAMSGCRGYLASSWLESSPLSDGIYRQHIWLICNSIFVTYGANFIGNFSHAS